MRFGVDHALKAVAVESLADHRRQGIDVPGIVARRDEIVAQRMEESRAPLRAEASAAIADRARQPRIVLHVLGDGDLPRLAAADLAVDPLQERPAVGQVGARIVIAAVDVADPPGRVEAQAVAPGLLEPAQRIVADVLAHRAAAVVGPRIAPRRLSPPVVVEVDAALPVLAPAVELPEI